MVAGLLASSIFAVNAEEIGERALWGSVCGTSNATTGDYKETLGKMLVTWRMLPTDNAETAFDLYRTIEGKGETKLNSTPIYATNYQDLTLTFGGRGDTDDVTYRLTYAGSDETLDTFTLGKS